MRLLLALPAFALAQGALTPSGTPAASMKSLDQIEARTPIGAVGGSTAPIVISRPGSYVLLGNVTVDSGNAIMIDVDNVTLDLNGFTISSTAAKPTTGGTGIRIFGPAAASSSATATSAARSESTRATEARPEAASRGASSAATTCSTPW